jgi:hypothetical protein
LKSGDAMNKIPIDEDFARVSREMAAWFQGVDAVEKRVAARFQKLCALHEFDLLPQGANSFAAYIFFERSQDVESTRIMESPRPLLVSSTQS